MKKNKMALIVIAMVFFAFIYPLSWIMAAEYHVTNSAEFWDALRTVDASSEDNIIYVGAGRYINDCFVTGAGGHSLTIMGEPGTSASQVIIDAARRDYCLKIIDYSLHPSITDLPYETVMDPAFERPQVIISGITFQNGDSEYNGGGLHIDAINYAVAVRNCIIRNNASSSSRGGGLSVISAFNLEIEDNTIINNIVHERLVYRGPHDDPRPVMQSRGGGIFVRNAWNGVILRNNIVANNVAEGNSSEGGGMYLSFNCGTAAQLINNTIYANRAFEGGGVHFTDIPSPGGTINLYNNIIYANVATGHEEGSDLKFVGPLGIAAVWSTTVNGFNNNFSHADGVFTTSANNMDVDPLFVNPAISDFHLAFGSPMINAGRNVVPVPPGLPDHDFEGEGRVNGGIPDIGADEYHPGSRRYFRRMPAGLDIRAGGKDGPFVIKPKTKVRLTFSLKANDDKGKKGRISIIMNSPKGKFYLSKKGWTQKRAFFFKGRLTDILPMDLPVPPVFSKKGVYVLRAGLEIQGQGHILSQIRKKHVMVTDSLVFHVIGKGHKVRNPQTPHPF